MIGADCGKEWTKAELAKFDRLTNRASSPGEHFDRNIARLELDRFVAEVGRGKCDAMFAHLKARDAKRG